MALLVSFLFLKNISGIAASVLDFEKAVKWLVSLLLMALTAGDGAPVVENSTEIL